MKTEPQTQPPARRGILDWIEWAGNKLPDPAALFLLALAITWVASAILSNIEFADIDPSTMLPGKTPQPVRVINQLTGEALVKFLTGMVKTFVEFPPLGVVLVALLGVGVAEHAGFIAACLKGLLSLTPKLLVSPMVLLVAIVSHSAGDTGYVLVIPLGGAIFAAAGRHPVAGIVCAFAGVSGGFSANFLPSGLDPLLQGFTQSSAQILVPGRTVNPLCNLWFTSVSCFVIVGAGWMLTDWVVEPRLARTPPDTDTSDIPKLTALEPVERRGLWWAFGSILLGAVLLTAAALPEGSPLRAADGKLGTSAAPLMQAIVPLIFLFFLLPGIVYGWVAGTFKTHRDVVAGMSKSMNTMGTYLVMAFFAAQFTKVFHESKVGVLLAVKGANALQTMGLPAEATLVGIILLTAGVNLLIGSASAKWALLGPIFVPMLMQLGYSPELTQAAYRVGDSSTNIVTPLMPYFPLIVVYCRKYLKDTGVGTLISLMLPYALVFLSLWTCLLLGFRALDIPLGLDARYTHP